MAEPSQRVLRTTLSVNALSSALSGAVLLAGAVPLARLLGLPGPRALVVFGALLLAFAFQVRLALHEPLDLRQARSIFAMDVAYVAASVVLLLAWPNVLSPLGRLLVALAADVVGVFCVFEYVGLRRARRGQAAVAP